MCNIVVIYTPNFFPIQDNKLFNFGEADANTGGGSPMGPRWSPPPQGGGEGTNYKTNHKNFHKKRGISNKPPYTNFILYKKVLKKLHILYINR